MGRDYLRELWSKELWDKEKRSRFLLLLLLNILMLTMLLPHSLAQQYGWCSKTIANKTCQPNVADYECEEGFSLQRPADCYEVTCIVGGNITTGEGFCLNAVPYRTCFEEMNGTPATPEAEQCVMGCCGINERMIGITTLARCKAIARSQGLPTDPDAGYMQWWGGLTGERECALKFVGFDRGCCFQAAGKCSYGYRKECSGTFFADTFCSAIPECNVKAKFKQGCGKMPGDEDKICWFDSNGNQEECIQECAVPAQICEVCPGPNNCTMVQPVVVEKCSLPGFCQRETTSIVTPLTPYCKSTDCDITGLGPDQIYEDGKWGGDFKWSLPAKRLNADTIPTGRSFCHNYFTGKAKVGGDEWIDVDIPEAQQKKFPRRSTGLQNHKIVCNYGRLEVFGTGTDRKKLCFDAEDNISAYVLPDTIVPDYSLCFKCGEGTAVLDYIGDMFRGGKRVFASIGYGDLVATLANECTPEACENIQKFPNGQSWCVHHSVVSGWTGGQHTEIDTACVPRYPPGTTEFCGQCGEGGDAFYNECEESEAYAMGNCMWREFSSGRQFLTAISLYGSLSNTAFFNAVPTYVTLGALADCIYTGLKGGPPFGPTCLADLERYYKDPEYQFKNNWASIIGGALSGLTGGGIAGGLGLGAAGLSGIIMPMIQK
jgi:hypothetical protein